MAIRRIGDYTLTAKQEETRTLRQQGSRVSEIAERLGVTVSCIDKRLRRIRALVESQRIQEQHRGE